MDIRTIPSYLKVVLFLAGLVIIYSGCDSRDSRPKLILIVVDDLGVSDVGFMGNTWYETPNMDRLAAEGMTFTQAYAAAAVCSPTRAAILTGKYPARLHLTDWIRPSVWRTGSEDPEGYVSHPGKKLICPQYPLRLDTLEVTLAELLREAGYSTKHIGKWHLGGQGYSPENQGFESNFGGCDFGQPPSYYAPYDAEWAPGGIPGVLPESRDEYLTDREAQEAVKFIREQKNKPFFLNLWHYAVHTPIEPKEQQRNHFLQKSLPENDLHPGYAAMISSVDEALGTIIETLKEEGLLKRTLILLTSDNGGHNAYTSNKPWRSGKGNPWEGGLRVPQVLFWPEKIKSGSEFTAPVASIDVLPTLCAAAGISVKETIEPDGINLLPYLVEDLPWERGDLYWHFPHYREYEDVRPYSIVRSGDWKLIRFWEGTLRLYNLKADPGEVTDLSDIEADKRKNLEKRLMNWLDKTNAATPEVDPDWMK
jgi:arylsulfatase A-like enzyme